MTQKNVLIVGFSESSHIDVVEKIAEEHQVITWLHPFNPKSQNLTSKHNIRSINSSQLSRIKSTPTSSLNLDLEVIETFAATETTFLSISDRLAFFPVSVRKRRLVYYHWLSHWLAFFTSQKVDLVLHSEAPHGGWDNVLFDVAKNKQVPQRILDRTSIAELLIYLSLIHISEPTRPY